MRDNLLPKCSNIQAEGKSGFFSYSQREKH